jgi:hypothetical protein
MTSGGGIDSNGPNPWSTAGVPQSAQAPQPPRRTPTPRNPNPIKGTTPTIGGPGWRLPKL